MASSYKKIQDYDYILWGIGSPVVVEKMRLCFDRVYGVNVLQITFRNVSNLKMYGLSISITLKNDEGKQIHAPIDFNYYAMEVATGKTFGGSEDIVVEKEATRFEITVTGADLAGGVRVFEKSPLDRIPVGNPLETLGELEEPFRAKLKEKYPKIKPAVVCEERNNYWRCVCDRIWPDDINNCANCKTDRAELLEILPELKAEERRRREEERRRAKEEAEQRLQEAKEAEEERKREEEKKRLEHEKKLREEQERLEEEERLRQEAEEERKRKRKKALLIGTPILVLLIAVVALAMFMKSRHQSRDLVSSETKISDEATRDTDKIEQTLPETEAATKAPEKEPDKEKAALPGPLFIIGEDMTPTEEEALWRLFGRAAEAFKDAETIRIPGYWGHTYMDSFIGRENVEDLAKSGMMILPRDDDKGLRISMYNITYFTEDDYASLLLEMGYENADVVIASPAASSGSTAMLGLYIKEARMLSASGQAIGVATAKGSINIRSGPGTEYPVLTTVTSGTELEVLEITETGWLKIAWPQSETGYAYTSNRTGTYYEFDQ